MAVAPIQPAIRPLLKSQLGKLLGRYASPVEQALTMISAGFPVNVAGGAAAPLSTKWAKLSSK